MLTCSQTSSPPPTNAGPWASDPTGSSTNGGRFLPEHTTAASLLDRLLHHASVVVTDGDSYRMREARAKGNGEERPGA
jgi:hypothetical protein